MSRPFDLLDVSGDFFSAISGQKKTEPEKPPDPIKVTLSELVHRRSSVIKLDGRFYRVRVTEIEVVR